MLRATDGQILYCACLVFIRPSGLTPKKIYLHASDLQTAENTIKRTYPNRNKVEITAIGPVVGVFAKDEKEEKGYVV